MKNLKYKEKSFVDIYFDEISKNGLLSREDEILIARNIRKYQIKKKTFKFRKLSGEEIKNYKSKLEGLERKLEKYSNKMLRGNYRLVVSVAKRYKSTHFSLEDLIEEGNLGLMRAVSKFDHRKGFRFSTFAVRWIKQNITKAIMDKGATIRIPVHIQKLLTKYRKVTSKYEKQHGHPPGIDYIEKQVGVPYKKIEMALRLPKKTASLDQKVTESDRDMGEIFSDETGSYDPHKQASKDFLLKTLHKGLDDLEERERMIVKMRYGIGDFDPTTLEVIGEKMGMTRERVRQIQTAALRKMREMNVFGELKIFLEH